MPTHTYKYESEMARAAGCPHNIGAPFNGNVYRAIHEDIDDPRNFSPKGVLDPSVSTHPGKSCNCPEWGLSMFETAAQLRRRVKQILKIVPKLNRKIGDRCAELELTAVHGARTPAKAGHFTFFQYSSFDGKSIIKSVAEILP